MKAVPAHRSLVRPRCRYAQCKNYTQPLTTWGATCYTTEWAIYCSDQCAQFAGEYTRGRRAIQDCIPKDEPPWLANPLRWTTWLAKWSERLVYIGPWPIEIWRSDLDRAASIQIRCPDRGFGIPWFLTGSPPGDWTPDYPNMRMRKLASGDKLTNSDRQALWWMDQIESGKTPFATQLKSFGW